MPTKILLIKTSSMGDVIHTLPAITDALNIIPDIEIDWVVEPAFADIPAMHPFVKKIILFPFRRWRKNIIHAIKSGEIRTFYRNLREKKYDVIIDAQGLMKSVLIASLARGETHGPNTESAREKIAAYFYRHAHAIDTRKQTHAITRMRQLFAKALHYDLPNSTPDYHINTAKLTPLSFSLEKKYFVFLHGTTWESKQYPTQYWEILLAKAAMHHIFVYLPFGNELEKKRAELLASNCKTAIVLPTLSIAEMAIVLHHATAVVGLDSGLTHLSAALSTPTISLYGPTHSDHIGAWGKNQIHFNVKFPCAPCYQKTCWYAKQYHTAISPTCFTTIDVDMIWEQLRNALFFH